MLTKASLVSHTEEVLSSHNNISNRIIGKHSHNHINSLRVLAPPLARSLSNQQTIMSLSCIAHQCRCMLEQETRPRIYYRYVSSSMCHDKMQQGIKMAHKGPTKATIIIRFLDIIEDQLHVTPTRHSTTFFIVSYMCELLNINTLPPISILNTTNNRTYFLPEKISTPCP